MPNRHGDLNIEEAAKYLEVSQSLMWQLYTAGGGPLYLLGVTPEEQAEAPWFTVADLDRFKPHMPAVIARMKNLTGEAGAPKSTVKAACGPA